MFIGIQKYLYLVLDKVKLTMSGIQLKMRRPGRKQKNRTPKKKKNGSIESDAELTELLGLPIKGITSVFVFIHLK